MVIAWVHREPQDGSAWAQIEAAQRVVRLPCLLVPQPAHAVLAGELAAALLPTAFGELPPEIQRAIQMHDTGWAASDAQQIQRLRSTSGSKAVPVSFIAISPQEAVEAWTASIDAVEAFSRPGAIIVSRHFSRIAQPDQAHHARFLQAEKARQRKLEGNASKSDLDRWTAALGFCDLVSLCLLSGLGREVDIPMAHPASEESRKAPHVSMLVDQHHLRFTPATLSSGCTLTVQALKHPVSAQGARFETLTWEVA
jgi:Protein of unknown function (DUF3891)